MPARYGVGHELADYEGTWRDDAGDIVDFSTGYTFTLKVGLPGEAAVFTKTSGITGAATAPNITVAWSTTGEIGALTAGVYMLQITPRRTADSKDRGPLQDRLEIVGGDLMADSEIAGLTEDTTPDATDNVYAQDAAGAVDKRVPLSALPVSTATQTALNAKQASDADLTALAAAGNSAVLAATTASFLTADETKLDGIEAGATADQTAAEILAALLTVDGSGSGLDADLLDGNSAAAFETPAGAQSKADAKVAETITNGVTTSAPSQDAAFDALALKADLASPVLTGNPTAPTQTAGNNSTRVATTAYSDALVADTAYDATSWNAVTGIAPSKNAVRDQVESLDGRIDSLETVTDIGDLPAADLTEELWTVPADEGGLTVGLDSVDLTSPQRVLARSDRYVGFEDFCGVPLILNATTTSLIGSTQFLLDTSGTTAGCIQNSSGALAFVPGLLELRTGTTSSTGRASAIQTGFSNLFYQARLYRFGARAAIPTVTTTGETFDTYIGFRAAWAAADTTDGIYFHAKAGTSAGNWFAVTEDDGTTTATDVDTGVAVDTGYHNFAIVLNGSQALFYIDGALEATLTANRPDNATALTAGAGVFKAVGTGSRLLRVDAMAWDLEYADAGSRGDLPNLLNP